ncbi:MAG: Tfp pilus assembly protein FimT/FimU [Chthoniobacterales bacterium]
MTTVRQFRRQPRGYTLIEIALVLAIMVMIIGAAIPLSSGFMREQRLRDVVRELLVLAKTARGEAMTTGRPTGVVFGKKGFGLLRPGEEEASETYLLPKGMAYVIRPFASEKALKPDGQTWIFQPTGLCEPVTFRVEENDAWMEVAFDPLTANIGEEAYEIP